MGIWLRLRPEGHHKKLIGTLQKNCKKQNKKTHNNVFTPEFVVSEYDALNGLQLSWDKADILRAVKQGDGENLSPACYTPARELISSGGHVPHGLSCEKLTWQWPKLNSALCFWPWHLTIYYWPAIYMSILWLVVLYLSQAEVHQVCKMVSKALTCTCFSLSLSSPPTASPFGHSTPASLL